VSDRAWERGARGSGIVAALLAIAGIFAAGSFPGVSASAAEVASYYVDNRGRALVTFMILAASITFFFWFLGAIVSTLREAGMGGWAASMVALGTARAMFLFSFLVVYAGLAYRIAETADEGVVAALQDLGWSIRVVSLWPLAGMIFVSAIGLLRARVVPGWFAWFAFPASVIVLLGGTTWAREGFWAPDGLYGLIAVLFGLAWMFLLSGLLLGLAPSRERAPGSAAAPQVR
jgi:MFS family permease